MRKIQDFLLDNEIILWKHMEIKNLLKIPLLETIIGIALTGMFSILFNVILYLLLNETFILILSLLILPIVIFIIFGFSLIIPGVKKYLEITNNLKLPSKRIMKYKEITAITNKRLIQKSYDIFEIDFKKNPITSLSNMEINRDLVFVDLQSINLVSIEELEEYHKIAFKFNKDDKNYLPLLLTIPNKDFPEFINILKKEIPLTKKKRAGNFIIDYYKS